MRLNGLDFHVEREGSGRPLLMLHGFTGSARTWAEVRPALAAHATVICVDLIGHGHSAKPAEAARYSLDWSTRDLVALLDRLELDAVDLLGYSMGGRVALQLALQAPARVSTLILESASAGIEDGSERRRRIHTDATLAERIVDEGIPAFVAEWERLPLLALAPHVAEVDRARLTSMRLGNNPLGLANSLRGMGAGQQTPLWPLLPQLKQRVLLVVGERDTRYRQVAQRMRSLLPAAELAVVPDAGHTTHIDQPRAFVSLLEQALGQTPASAAPACATN
ncbi:MAG: 2-succinyl-6-hydroxy-2,4-cyclohexadiene-1-carboxylate synthase [Chloroflexota bacterium]